MKFPKSTELTWVYGGTNNGRGCWYYAVSYIGGKKRKYIIRSYDYRKCTLSCTHNDGRHSVFYKDYDNFYTAQGAANKHNHEVLEMFKNQYVKDEHNFKSLMFRKLNHSTYVAKVCIRGKTRTYRINTNKRHPTLEITGFEPMKKEAYNDLYCAMLSAHIEHRYIFGLTR